MYRLHNFLREYLFIESEQIVSEELFCLHVNAEKVFLINKMQESLKCYTFTLVTHGWLKIISNKREMMLTSGDLYTYAPGFSISILSASEDYRSICLLADEVMTFDLPVVRNAIRVAYSPMVQLSEPKLHLSDDSTKRLERRMNLAIEYQESDHLFLHESLRTVYTLFLLDVMNIMKRTLIHNTISERTENIFIGFIRLLSQHFTEHHDVAYYAGQLCITSTHLSRIVRQVTNRTVVDYINHMLLMEASWLLQSTNLSIATIAERLHFANQSSFGRFFTRMKGIPPKVYRMKR
ncbi:helix-turn-helix domain-containing protein [Porphyromonas macacae]|uniref:helix-turn-helix domain-containing protein n=1 Tax=Porphyromonas macacae TaxID=28115 RepID=UPI00068B900D|nr:helix-turn-helix domain-containing protein [Porphyromonas macacae]